MKEDLFLKIQKAVIELDEENLTTLTDNAIESGIRPVELIEKAYSVGIQEIGRLFETGEIYLPEMARAAEIVKEAIVKVEKLIPQNEIVRKGKVLIGTVAGDIHNIGKNLVITWLSTHGFEVVDIGVDCQVDSFIDNALKEDADIIGASCLLTMTSPELKKLIDRMKEREIRDRFMVIVGGAAINKAWADEIGADGFADDMVEAAEVSKSLIEKRNRAK